MELRTAASPKDVKHYTTDRLREEFLIDDLFQKDVIKLVYSHIDRIITGSAVPVKETLLLTAGDEIRAEYFLERREMGVINIGGAGVITIDGKEYDVAYKEGMYIGMGAKDISFASVDAENPAKFYLNSAPAHKSYPTVLIKPEGTPKEGVVIVREDAFVFHYMGEPTETRHIVMKNEQAVISPSWSIHSGCGTRAYTFIWGMVGENQAFCFPVVLL